MCILGKISCLADLVFDPTLAFARFAEDLLHPAAGLLFFKI